MTWATSFSDMMSPQHLGAIRALGATLKLGTRESWDNLLPILIARLSEEERAALAFVALKTLTPTQAAETALSALPSGAGRPLPALFSCMDEAALWADMAEPEELDAYCLASFNSMHPRRQAAFLHFVTRRRAA
ncbi:hypothetical protein [Alloyangia pacifica]|uniref:hypothetical protein n=1 Tax=Alloyangia pacifica TaxID=311180 RepID=UPI001CFF20E2|nr:hypothetical protein [Alloyangia pacifica]